MKFRWKLIVQLLIPLCLCIAVISGWAAKKKMATVQQLAQQIEQKQRESKKLDVAYSELQKQKIAYAHEIKGIEQNTLEVIRMLYVGRSKYEIGLNSIGTDKPLGPSGVRVLKDLIQPVAATELKRTKLIVKGKYLDYQKFMAFMNELHSLPIALIAMKASGQDFEIVLLVYGM